MRLRLSDWVRQFDRTPVVPLAGYPGAQLTGSTIKQNMFNAELHARSLYKLAERTDPDALFVMMDLSVEGGALGLPVRYPLADSAAVEWHPVRDVRDLEQYKVIEPLYDGRVWVFLETVRLLRRKLTIPVGAYVSGPFTLAGLMLGANEIALATLEAPHVVRAAVNFCEHVIIDYARALTEAGADLICILDPTAVMLSPEAFWDFAGRSIQNVVRRLDTRMLLHICGNTTHLTEPMCRTGVQALSLDALVDLPALAPRVPADVVLMGNVEPVSTMLRGTPDDVRREARALLTAMAGRRNFVLSTGCDLPAETPVENIAALVAAAREDEPATK